MRFDYKPLEDAFLALAFVGHLDQRLRSSYFNGDIQSWSSADLRRGIVDTYYKTLDFADEWDRKWTSEIIPAQVIASRSPWPTISQTAQAAPFYRSALSGFYFSRCEKYGLDPNIPRGAYDKGQTFWLERQDANTYWLNFGFLDYAYTSKYQVTIDDFVPPKDDDDGDGGGK